jgi:protein TonB
MDARGGGLTQALVWSAILHVALLHGLSIQTLRGGTAGPALHIDLIPRPSGSKPAVSPNQLASARPTGSRVSVPAARPAVVSEAGSQSLRAVRQHRAGSASTRRPQAMGARPAPLDQAAGTRRASVHGPSMPAPGSRPPEKTPRPLAGEATPTLTGAAGAVPGPRQPARETVGKGDPGAVSARAPDRGLVVAYRPEPVYPRLARRRGLQGEVIVEAEVGADGRPRRVKIKRSSGWSSLDDAAARAVQQWRFSAAQRDGRAVAATAEIPIRFRLQDG